MKKLLTIFLLGFFAIASAQEDKSLDFDELMKRSKATFTLPKNFKKLEIESFRKVPHQLVIQSKDKKCQIRYWVDALDEKVTEYNKLSEEGKKNSLAPNAFCKSMMMLAVLNASNNKSQAFKVSDDLKLTKELYNADWEAVAMIEAGWPQLGYKYCYIHCLHKDDSADIYKFVLANSEEDLKAYLETALKSIKFNKE